jgi:hypothetical protein
VCGQPKESRGRPPRRYPRKQATQQEQGSTGSFHPRHYQPECRGSSAAPAIAPGTQDLHFRYRKVRLNLSKARLPTECNITACLHHTKTIKEQNPNTPLPACPSTARQQTPSKTFLAGSNPSWFSASRLPRSPPQQYRPDVFSCAFAFLTPQWGSKCSSQR